MQIIAISDDNWWLKYTPQPLESMEVYLNRMSNREDMEFVMMAVTEEQLRIVAQSYEITAVRHAYESGLYAVMIIRDLIFLTYTERFRCVTK